MGNTEKRVGLSRSQSEIALSEEVYPGSALNTISVTMFFEDYSAEKAAAACDRVFESSDVFKAALVKEGTGYCFYPDSRQILPCLISVKRTREQAEDYISGLNAQSMVFPRNLYHAEAFDLEEGGSALIVRFHHILTDGYGMSLFAQRVADALEGRAFSRSVFFGNDGKLSADSSPGDTEFWRTYFSDNTAEPAVFSEKAEGFGKTSVPVLLGNDLQNAARHISERCGVTLPYVYAAAYAVYLRGAAGKSDAVFLMARLNRSPSEMETIGCYTQVVPVRIHISSEDSFDDVCRAVSASAKAASAHKAAGFSSIMRILREGHGIAESPSMYDFNWYSRPLQSETPVRLRFSTAGEMRGHLAWNIFTDRNGLTSSFDLRDGVYDATRAEYLSDSLCSIIRGGEGNPRVRNISLTAREETKRLSAVCGTEYGIDGSATIPSLLRSAAKRYGSAPALFADGRSFTFSELDALTDNIAGNLIAKGVRPGDRVAFMLKRGALLIPTLFGISRAGAVFIPVDPAYPKDRIEYILNDSRVKILITDNGTNGGIKASDLLGDCEDGIALPEISQNDTAYMIYTSGTTGKPKGVMLPHRGIVNIVHPENNPFNKDVVQNGHGIVAIGSICFDISLFEIFVPLFNGKFVVLGNERAMVEASALSECIREYGADILHCTPSRIAAYLKDPDFRTSIKGIQMILSAGEVLPGSLVLTLKEKYGIRIYNGYGPTETTIGAAISEAGDSETIGRPIGNTGILLLNGEGNAVPYGAVGEICVYGNGVGSGYYRRDEETREKFVEHGGRRIYRTGDLGRFSEDGRLIYHGRCDRQIKLRGLRIELSEIESVMLAFPDIGQAVCLVKKTGHTERLIGFYTHNWGKDVGGELKAHLKRCLTEYMIPDILFRLDEMPRTPGGKLDMSALEKIGADIPKHYAAPKNHEEKMICEAFEEVIEETGAIDAEDNFFESGMDSLSAALFMVRIEEKLPGADVEYSDIFACPTAALLAERLRDGGQRSGFAVDGYDYSGFGQLVNRDVTSPVSERFMGNILLTGATGYLGIHILLELLKTPERFDKVFCLVRPKGKMTAQKRLRSALFYYGENDYPELYGTKWEVVEGDITDPSLADIISEPVHTVLHAAANVAHFAHDDSIEKANVGGVRSVIGFALSKNARVCHISTISVAGVAERNRELPPFTERDLYIGQEIYNRYIWSKYLAEYEIMRSAVDRGLSFVIMRVGNLQGRIRDGEFQMNMKTNNFTRCLSSYVKMGAVPRSVFESAVNFSPVDEVARMIVSLSAADRSNAVYHVCPEKETVFADIFAALRENGHEIKPVPDEEFEKLLNKYKHDPDRRETVEGLLTEKPNGNYRGVPITQEDTSRVLRLLGKQWAPVTGEYLKKYICALDQLNMFE